MGKWKAIKCSDNSFSVIVDNGTWGDLIVVAGNLHEDIARQIVREHNAHEELVAIAKEYRESLEAIETIIMNTANLTLPHMGDAPAKAKEEYFALIQATDGFKREYVRLDAVLARAEGGGN